MFATFVLFLASAGMVSSSRIPTSTQKFSLDISAFAVTPDGFRTTVYGANGMMVYPIIINKGDAVEVKVSNHLDVPTAIHYHGLFQRGSNAYDGAGGITQCPIPPGKSLTYKFSVPGQHGTFWWHSHNKAQLVKGLRGPLIIRDPNEYYAKIYDEEYIVMLTDWYHAEKSDTLLKKLFDDPDSVEPFPDSGLINGKGRYNCSRVADNTPCDSNSPREVFHFTQDKSYRLRVINGAAEAIYNFSIDGHKLQVIEADGVETELTTVDVLRISPGQRYSVIVKADADVKGYWMRATIDPMSYSHPPTNAYDPEVLAVVSYTGDSIIADPTTSGPAANAVVINEHTLPARQPVHLPDYHLKKLNVSFLFARDANRVNHAYITVDNHVVNSSFSVPSNAFALNQVISTGFAQTSVNPVYIDNSDIVEITVYNDDTMDHPFHLHGHNFLVTGSGVLKNSDEVPKYSSGPRPQRDTVTVPACTDYGNDNCGGTRGYAIVRFKADNPGVWLFHCHMEWHVVQGLALTFVIDAPTVRQRKIADDVKMLCPN